MIEVKIVVKGESAGDPSYGGHQRCAETHVFTDSFISGGKDREEANFFFKRLVANAALLKRGVQK